MSNFKLWELPSVIETAEEMMINPETGELLDEEALEGLLDELNLERDSKIEYLCKLVKNLNAEADACKAQKQLFDKRATVATHKAESLKQYIRFALAGEKWEAADSSVKVSYRNTKGTVKIDDVTLLPDQFFKTPHTESNASKTAIKESIEMGYKVPGAHLEDSVSVIIK